MSHSIFGLEEVVDDDKSVNDHCIVNLHSHWSIFGYNIITHLQHIIHMLLFI